jgi:predicted kinase
MDWTPLRDIPDPALVVLCGASGSGKSTIATYWPGQVVSSDALRELIGAGQDREDHREVFDLLHRIVAMRLRRDLRTVVDATNTAQWHRGPLLALAAAHQVPAYAVVCWPTLVTCLQRNAHRAEGRVPENVVRSQYEQLTEQMPSRAEGFAQVIITGAADWLQQVKVTKNKQAGPM